MNLPILSYVLFKFHIVLERDFPTTTSTTSTTTTTTTPTTSTTPTTTSTTTTTTTSTTVTTTSTTTLTSTLTSTTEATTRYPPGEANTSAKITKCPSGVDSSGDAWPTGKIGKESFKTCPPGTKGTFQHKELTLYVK